MTDKERSEANAMIINSIKQLVEVLDIENLRECLKLYRDQIGMREALPFPQMQETVDLERAKYKQLELYIQLYDNIQQVKKETLDLRGRRGVMEQLNRSLGL